MATGVEGPGVEATAVRVPALAVLAQILLRRRLRGPGRGPDEGTLARLACDAAAAPLGMA